MKPAFFLILFILPFLAFAQEDAWVYFKDKPDAAFYKANPLQMLSQRALDRRQKQNIPLDDKDIPVYLPYIGQVKLFEGISLMATSKWMNALHVRGSVNDITALGELPFVAEVRFANRQLNSGGRLAAQAQFSTVNKTMETAADLNYGTSARQIEMLNGHLLHQRDYTGEGKIIAVLDSGFPGVNNLQPFERLIEKNLILGGYNFVDRSGDFYTGNSHGTLVLSTMGGFTEGQLIGTAPDAAYYLFITEDTRSENPLEESLWVEAAEMADSLGVDVINTSLGYFLYDNPAYSYTYNDIDGQTAFITRGAAIAFSRGMICVTSAGNTGNTTNPNITVPADGINVLTVGAVDANENYASFSSRGPTFDGRVKPDVMAQGAFSVISDTNGNSTTANGTSFSSPITAGLVACLWQALPDKTNAEILQLIKESADRFNDPNALYGYGIPDFGVILSQQLDSGSKPERFLLYPNPVRTDANLIFPDKTESATVTVFNTLGQLVLQEIVLKDNPVLQVGGLAAGIYSYTIQAEQHLYKGKLIKE